MKVLIFVHNADSKVKARFHKLFSPKNNKCKLYKLTYGKIFMKREWRNFLGNLSYQKVFFHKKEFKKAHPEFAYLELPSILMKSGDKISVIVTAQEINALDNVDDLIGLLGNKLM